MTEKEVKVDFNNLINDYIQQLNKVALVDEKQLLGYFLVEIEDCYCKLSAQIETISYCLKNKEYLKELKKLNRKYKP